MYYEYYDPRSIVGRYSISRGSGHSSSNFLLLWHKLCSLGLIVISTKQLR